MSKDGRERRRYAYVEGPSLPLQSVDDVQRGDGLPLGVLGVGYGVTDDVLKEHFKHTASLLVDQTGDTFHATSASQTTDGGLRDTLDVITKYLPVTLGSSFSQTLSSLTAAGHLLSRKSNTNNIIHSTRVCAHEPRERLEYFSPPKLSYIYTKRGAQRAGRRRREVRGAK